MYLEISNPMDYHVGLYIRLSKEDENEGPSESVTNQRSLLNEFIKKTKVKELKNIEIYLPENYIPNGIVSFNVIGYTSDEVGTILSEEFGICVRTGFHCAPYIHDFINSRKYSGTVRISFNGFNTKNEIDEFISVLKEL